MLDIFSKIYSYIQFKNDNSYVYLLTIITISGEHIDLNDIQVKFVTFCDIILCVM